MTFEARARRVARECAQRLEQEAETIGVFRSLDATRSAQWLHELADAIRQAAAEPTAVAIDEPSVSTPEPD